MHLSLRTTSTAALAACASLALAMTPATGAAVPASTISSGAFALAAQAATAS